MLIGVPNTPHWLLHVMVQNGGFEHYDNVLHEPLDTKQLASAFVLRGLGKQREEF